MFVAPAYLNDTKGLFKYLFDDNGYDTRVIPIEDQNDTLFVHVHFFLMRVSEIDEVKETMTTVVYFYMGWCDDNLKWNTTMFNDIDHIHVPQSDVWKPELPLENGIAKMNEFGDPIRLMLVWFDGFVQWWPFEVLTTTCAIDITYYPFDKQTCHIIFGVWTYTLEEIDVSMYASDIDMSEYQTNGQWDVIKTSAVKSNSYGKALVTFSITMKRKPQYIINSVVLPIMMLSILSVFTFVLPIDCGEKMGFSMTLYLAFAVFLTI
ncbi:neuronal acetylcholine receptor subunit alpha-6-like, partial [Mizuhopecten yessoensis]